jgi:hypothetical protein
MIRLAVPLPLVRLLEKYLQHYRSVLLNGRPDPGLYSSPVMVSPLRSIR